MGVRKSFEEELKELKTIVTKMGQKSVYSLEESITALVNQDVERALKVIDIDYKIDRFNHEINEKSIWLIAKQQPVASDLRRIFSSIRISTDLERIGDIAVNIAKSTIRLGEKDLIKPLYDIPAMAEKATMMIKEVMQAFEDEDADRAREIALIDNDVDEMFGSFIQELLEYINQEPTATSQVTQLSFICRDLERVGDHATNISESIIFMVIGKLYDLNA